MEEKDRYTEWCGEHGAGRPGKDCYTQLAKYEDSGLSPEEVMLLAKADGKNHQEIEKHSEYEYVMFAWNTRTEQYEPTGRPMVNEWLARDRFYEYVQKGWFNKVYDTNKAVMKRRMITTLKEEWEEVEVNEHE